MKHIEAGDYTVKQLMAFLSAEANEAVDYIESVIQDYENAPHKSEHFSDVLLIEDYVYNPNPTGQLRKSLWGRRGVYVFVVKESFHLSYEEVSEYCSQCSGAGFPDWHEKDIEEGQHFYQGSAASKSLHSRMKDHYSEHSNIAAIQLNNPHRVIVKDKLKVFVFPVIRKLDNESFFIRMVEDRLHERFPAITGNRRT